MNKAEVQANPETWRLNTRKLVEAKHPEYLAETCRSTEEAKHSLPELVAETCVAETCVVFVSCLLLGGRPAAAAAAAEAEVNELGG